jgi:hypothetical protein
MDELSWRSLAYLGAGIVAFFAFLGGVFVVREQFFSDARETVTRWEPKAVSEDGKTITIEYTTARCISYDRHVERMETASAVTLTVIIRERGDCEDIALYHTTEVELDRPLGDRRLIDGRTGTRPDFETMTPTSG